MTTLNKNVLDAAISAGAKLVVAENLYMYGDTNGNKMMWQLVGLLIRDAGEVVEIMREFEKPFVMDASKFIRAFGGIATLQREAIKQTLAWYHQNLEA